MPDRSVSVVIPTIGRASLLDAIASVLAQSRPAEEVVVCFDGPLDSAPLHLRDLHSSISVIATEGSLGPSGARNLAIAHSSGDLVATLDDDDLWTSTKLEEQLSSLGQQPDEAWVSTTAVTTSGATPGEVWPSRGPIAGETVSEYLFVRSLGRLHPFLQTSTWIAPRSLFLAHPFRADELMRLCGHDDYEWLIRAEADFNARILFNAEPTTVYTVMNADSFGVRTRWTNSLTWIEDPALPVDRRVRGDFILKIPLSMALRSDGRTTALRVLRRAFSQGRPTVLALMIALTKIARG